MKNKVIAFITHTSESNKFTHIHTDKKQHSHSRCNCVQKNIKQTEQPELHQLTTKQQRKEYYPTETKITQQ